MIPNLFDMIHFPHSIKICVSYNLLVPRGVIDMVHINISITLLKQYSLLSLVNTYINVSKYPKNENGHLEKKLRPEYCWCC